MDEERWLKGVRVHTLGLRSDHPLGDLRRLLTGASEKVLGPKAGEVPEPLKDVPSTVLKRTIFS